MPLIDIGQAIPDFKSTDHTGAPVSRDALSGSRFVLFFYPKDDSKDCTTQACEFSDATKPFAAAGVKVFGVSPDTEKDHQKFAAKHKLGFPILVDTRDAAGTPRICHDFGVWQEKSMYGRKYMGVVRTTYLVDAKGVVEHRWDKVSVTGHVAAVLAKAKGDTATETTKPAKKSPAKKMAKKTAKKTPNKAPAAKPRPKK
ncbi:MAG: peroxiredoxin [Phycisphaerales bacterium]|jgi:peroxiredoxin Q/BCP